MSEAPKPEGPVRLDMDFGEALARFVQTKPEEVAPAPGQKSKPARPSASRFAPGITDNAEAHAKSVYRETSKRQ